MGKETVRYPDALVARIEELVADSEVFESKSELHRFASDFFLCLLDPDHESTVLGYEDILADLEAESGVSLQPDDVATSDSDTPFLESYLHVRRSLLHGELDEARAYVSETYTITDREAMLLDELIGLHRDGGTDTRPVARPPRPPVADDRAHTNGESPSPVRNDHEPSDDSGADSKTRSESEPEVFVTEESEDRTSPQSAEPGSD
ncbi:MAG: hypothetical protein ABEI77_05120 [Halorientalis sp.]